MHFIKINRAYIFIKYFSGSDHVYLNLISAEIGTHVLCEQFKSQILSEIDVL